MSIKNIVIIGGGASGFFAAINAAHNYPEAKITIIEKSNKVLSKVRVSGGGRCNVTHHCFDNVELVKNYPRGQKELQQVFAQFSVTDTIVWFEKRGVKLKVEPDGRMFPESNSSETIINCFLNECQKLNIDIKLSEEVLEINEGPVLDSARTDNLLFHSSELSSSTLSFRAESRNRTISIKTNKQSYTANAIICGIGGHHQLKNYEFIKQKTHSIDDLIPSLFTLNLPQSNIKELMGLSVKHATVRVNGTKHQYTGPLLITHWGLSGPAVLKLSAFAAQDFYKLNYHAGIAVNWSGTLNENQILELINVNLTSRALIVNSPLFDMPKRLWEYLVLKADLSITKPWVELGKKQAQKLAQLLSNDVYAMQGKTTFKEEFVTAGGVNLKEINFKTMESKLMPGLYFCGEVLNIDGITGGFNFQNAWSTAWVAAKNCLN